MRVAVALVASWFACVAQAQAQTPPPSGAVARFDFLHVFDRLDAVGVGLTIGAVLIVVLLVLRVWSMARSERPTRPARTPPPSTRLRANTSAKDLEPLDRQTLQGATDWGFDQNKRSSSSRQKAPGENLSATMPSMEMGAGQWSRSEVHNATQVSLQANESMGKSPNAADSPYRTAFNPYYKGDVRSSAMEVVEVADTLLQAELLVQLGDPKQAMTLLSNHIRETQNPGPAVWLMLLNLYQTTGRKSQYEALATGFKALFNAAVPAWANAQEAARDIESYAQVMMKLHTNWGKPEVRPILEGLLNDDRGGSRQGFSLAAYRELLFLVEIVAELDKMAVEEVEREDIQRKLGRIG